MSAPFEDPTRRAVRLRCLLVAGEAEVAAFTTLVSTAALELRVDAELAKDVPAELLATPGGRVAVECHFPDGGPALLLNGRLAWSSPEERDPRGALVLGLGVELRDNSPAALERVHELVTRFRPTVAICEPDPHERARWVALCEPDHPVVGVADVAELRIAERTHDLAVVVSGPGLDAAAVAEVGRVLGATRGVHLSLAPHVDDAAVEILNLGRLRGALGRPLFEDVAQQAIHRSVAWYELAVENHRLGVELERRNARLRRENAFLRKRLTSVAGFERILGQSEALRRALDELHRIRRTDATVHLRGETGTGKELAARGLHVGGPRAKGPFVAQNCGGLSESLLLSTLFGHKKGSFTGADRDRPGVFQEAHGGTLFLDEVAELSPSVQASLLRALQEREVTPLGATRPEKVDVRIISATHKDLRAEVDAGRFREDLFFRLVVIAVRLPSLRERTGDVPALLQHFLDLACTRYGKDLPGFTAEAMRRLERHDWPGNVRELENEVERLVILANDGEPIGVELLSEHLQERRSPTAAPGMAFDPTRGLDHALAEVERQMLSDALQRHAGNRTAVAKELRLPRQTLNDRLRKLGLGKG